MNAFDLEWLKSVEPAPPSEDPTYDERLARARTAGVVVSYWGLPDVLMAQLAGHLGEVPLVSERDAYRIAEAGAMWLAICPVYGDDVEIIRRVPDGPDIDAQCNIVREIGRRTVTVPSVHHASIPSTLGTPLVTPDLAALAQHVLAYVEEAAR